MAHLKILGTDYGLRVKELEIENQTFRIYFYKKDLSIEIVDVCKKFEGEYISVGFKQKDIFKYSWGAIIRDVFLEVKRLIEKFLGKIQTFVG